MPERVGLSSAQPVAAKVCPGGPLRIVLVRLSPTKIGQDPVTHELGDMPRVTRNLARDRVLVGANDLAHILRIEP